MPVARERYAPPVHMIRLTQEREITPYGSASTRAFVNYFDQIDFL
jgi:hypothetical protein